MQEEGEGEGASWQEQGGFICNAAVCVQALNSREAVQVCRALNVALLLPAIAMRDLRRQLGQRCGFGHEEFSLERRSGLSNPSCWAMPPCDEHARSDAEAQTPLQKFCGLCRR